MIKKLEAVIFDLDGVIVDTSKYHFKAWQKLSSEIGIKINKDFNKNLKGVSRSESLKKILKLFDKNYPSKEKNSFLERKNNYYLEYLSNINSKNLLPGTKECFEILKFNKIKIALASMSKNASIVIDQLKIEHYFDFIIDSNSIKNSKPDPEIFIRAVKGVNSSCSNCIGVEDSIAGVLALSRCEIMSIGIGNYKELYMANIVIKNLLEFNLRTIYQYGGFNV